jgi:class 3 adenylate cyclase
MNESISERKLALLTVDLTGYTRAAAGARAVDVATFLDGYYRLCAMAVKQHGGRVVKFMGDACFAVFPEELAVAAVECALDLQREAPSRSAVLYGERTPAVGANVHLAIVAEGMLGADDDKRYDVFGEGVNHLFRMGGGAGIRISEPVYRSLPNERRGPWQKTKPPATYVLG